MLKGLAQWLERGLPPSQAADPVTEACVFWYLVLTPLWWMTGTLIPLGVIGTGILFLRRPPRQLAIRVVSSLWIAVGAAQALSVVVNWAATDGTEMSLLRGLGSFVTTGWILIGLAIGVGAEGGLTTPRMVRAICVHAAWMLLLTGVSLFTAVGLGWPELVVPSPLALLLPGELPVVRFHLRMIFYQSDALLDTRTIRLTLFYPWATGLALAGATALLVGTGDRLRGWRVVAAIAGTVAVLLSYSRSAVLSLAVALVILGFLRLSGPRQAIAALLAGLAINVALLAGFDPIETAREVQAEFTNLRPGSSLARALIYELSWAHFLDRPILGHGWMSGPVARWLPTMPLGSHSSFYGVLYLGGIVTFAALCLAYLATLAVAALRLRDRGRDAPVALVLLLLLGVVAVGEGINVLVPSLLATFLWLGGALRSPAAAAVRVGIAADAGRRGHAPVPAPAR
jgi:uncharacterized membrane protein YhaH (DUF805 family)